MNKTELDIRARKISQLPDLDLSDYEHLYFALGYNNDNGQVANYKINILQLAQTLVDTGLISTSSAVHYISYAGLVNITTISRQEFEGRTYTINLIPNVGFALPDNISVNGAEIMSYNKDTGELRIDAGNREGVIYISGEAVYIEYELNIDLVSITYTNDNVKNTYHVNDEILLTLTTVDQDHYDIPARNELSLSGLSIVSYNNDLGYTGTVKLKFNGSGNGNVTGTAKRIYLYYFGYSILNDNVLTYDEHGTPIAPGTRFNTLMKGRNVCPIDYSRGFDYGNGVDEVPDSEVINKNIYIVVPQKYYLQNNNIYKDDNNLGYKMLAGNSSFERQVQTTEDAAAEKMIYTFRYEDIDYYALCISTEGIIGHQMFKSLGNISSLTTGIRWESPIPVKIAAGTSTNIPKGVVKLIFGDDHEETIETGFAISYNDSLGTFNDYTYYAPRIEDLTDERNVIKFTCNYLEFTDTISTIVYIPGEDDELVEIGYEDTINDIEYNQTFILDKNKVYGVRDNGTTYHFSLLNQIRFECEYGTITNNGDNTFTYTAPFRQIDAIESLNIIYKESYIKNIRFTIISPDFHDIIWPTVLPKGIYDTETIALDTTIYKVMDENDAYQKVTGGFTVETDHGTITTSGGKYIYNPPYIADPNPSTSVNEGETLSGDEQNAPNVNSYMYVNITIRYKHCQTTKQIIVNHGQTPQLTDFYWYCGQYCPTSLTNPVNDIANYNEIATDPGWRKIDNSLAYYRNPQSVFDGIVRFYQGYNGSVPYYIAVPKDILVYDTSGIALVDSTSPYSRIVIAGSEYNVYSFNASQTFANKLYYYKEAATYWYIGIEYPQDPVANPELVTATYGDTIGNQTQIRSGWHTIPNINELRANHEHIFGDVNASWADYSDNHFYLVVPAGSVILDAMGVDVTQADNYDRQTSMTIDGLGYDVYNVSGNEFGHRIYP